MVSLLALNAVYLGSGTDRPKLTTILLVLAVFPISTHN